MIKLISIFFISYNIFIHFKKLFYGYNTNFLANLLYGVPFKNNLRKRVRFKTNSGGGLLFTCNPPLLLAASLYRYWQQRDAGGIAIGISDTLVSPSVAAEQKLSHEACVAIQTGETC